MSVGILFPALGHVAPCSVPPMLTARGCGKICCPTNPSKVQKVSEQRFCKCIPMNRPPGMRGGGVLLTMHSPEPHTRPSGRGPGTRICIQVFPRSPANSYLKTRFCFRLLFTRMPCFGLGKLLSLPVLSKGRVEWYLGALNGKCQSLCPCECDLRSPVPSIGPAVSSSVAGGWPPHVLTLPMYQCR